MRVPFNRPVVLPEHKDFLARALQSGHLSGCGEMTKEAEAGLEKLLGQRTLLCTSGTHALEMAALLLDLTPGDEVIVPSFTFVSTANAFVLRGARIRFADNDEHGNIRLSEVERLLTKKTKAVVAVHYGGTSADMTRLSAICADAGVALIEDAAQAILARCHGRPLGTFGLAGCFSFHETKNLSTGEGGALCIEGKANIERAEILREKGTNRTQFFQGLVDKYTWIDVGSSYVLSELNVALLVPQIARAQEITAQRGRVWARYVAELEAPLAARGATILRPPAYNEPNYHMCAVVFAEPSHRERFVRHMRERQITAPFHYLSLHSSPHGRRVQPADVREPEHLPGAERLSGCLVRLPVFYSLSDDEQAHVIRSAKEFLAEL